MIAVAATALILFVTVAVLFLRPRSGSQPAGPNVSPNWGNGKSIAVLPFENLSAEPDNAYFADGVQEEILTRLSRIADLKVISRTSTQRYKSAPQSLAEIAKQLGVAHVLEGTVQKSADQVRVNVQLIDARNDSHVWADNYDRKLTDIFAVETEIATKIAETLKAKLTGGEQRAVASRPTENAEAHELYLRGRYFAAKRIGDSLKTAADYFNQAVTKDPHFALAYAGLADSYVLLPEYSNVPPAECFSKAKTAANQALAIDPDLAEAHTSLGLLLASDDINFTAARREFERAIELDPNLSTAHYFLGIANLAPLGQFDRAISEIKRALELDPLSVIMSANLGYCYFLARRYPEAVAAGRKAVELDPNFPFPRAVLAMALEKSGDTGSAFAEAAKTYEIRQAVQPVSFLIYLYGSHGQRSKAVQLENQLRELEESRNIVRAYSHAFASIGLGDHQQAIDWLERSYQAKESGAIIYIKVDPMLDPLRGDARFEKLANQVVPADLK
jgi:TolB-like protein/Flp pilus assembly protein TadD